jgi:hypothetical protein
MRDEEKREYLILFQSKRIQAPDARDHQALRCPAIRERRLEKEPRKMK